MCSSEPLQRTRFVPPTLYTPTSHAIGARFLSTRTSEWQQPRATSIPFFPQPALARLVTSSRLASSWLASSRLSSSQLVSPRATDHLAWPSDRLEQVSSSACGGHRRSSYQTRITNPPHIAYHGFELSTNATDATPTSSRFGTRGPTLSQNSIGQQPCTLFAVGDRDRPTPLSQTSPFLRHVGRHLNLTMHNRFRSAQRPHFPRALHHAPNTHTFDTTHFISAIAKIFSFGTTRHTTATTTTTTTPQQPQPQPQPISSLSSPFFNTHLHLPITRVPVILYVTLPFHFIILLN
jgi:hypothetical protein